MFRFKNELRWNNVRLEGQLIKKKERFVFLGSVVLENVANVEGDVKFVELVVVI